MDEWIDGRKNVKWIAGINGELINKWCLDGQIPKVIMDCDYRDLKAIILINSIYVLL